jgi:hypothetical protein
MTPDVVAAPVLSAIEPAMIPAMPAAPTAITPRRIQRADTGPRYLRR